MSIALLEVRYTLTSIADGYTARARSSQFATFRNSSYEHMETTFHSLHDVPAYANTKTSGAGLICVKSHCSWSAFIVCAIIRYLQQPAAPYRRKPAAGAPGRSAFGLLLPTSEL